MLPFSFSYADNWNIGLKKLVDKQTEVDVIKYMSAQNIKQYYYAHKNWRMKALTFGVRSFFWSGLLYLGIEATANLLEQLANAKMQEGGNGDFSVAPGTCIAYKGWSSSRCGKNVFNGINADGSVRIKQATNWVCSSLHDMRIRVYDENGSYTEIDVSPNPIQYTNYNEQIAPFLCSNGHDGTNNMTFEQALDWVLANKHDEIQNSLNNEPKELLDPSTAQKMGLYVPPYITGASEGEDNSNAPAPFGGVTPSNGVGYGGSVSSGSGGEQKSTFKAPNGKYFIDGGTGAAPVISDNPEEGSSFENQGEVENAPAPKEGEDFVTPPQLQAPEFDTNIDVPEKKDYTNLLEQFISNSPVYHILADTEIKTSGSVCSLNATWKGHIIKFSMCEFQSSLEAVGALILMFAHIMAIMIIFKN